MKQHRKTGILDCTIRDGSYLINYQFTAEDAFLVSDLLAQCGIERIEVGHGLGLDAQTKGKGAAAASDADFIKAAVSAAKGRAKIGVFFIPGIGDLDSIRRAADLGLDFIRIGTNIEERRDATEPIALAKSLKLETWSNLMKSYAVPPDTFATACDDMRDAGADMIALVDSAGGMTPTEVTTYVSAAAARSHTLGFHGHNNLQLATANCLAAVEAGCAFIDSSLRGIGRSAGNAPTELLCALLLREGIDIGPIDYRRLIRAAQKLIAPMMPRDTGLLPIEIASGISYFHSSFQPLVDKTSARHGVDPFETILEIGAAAKPGVNDATVEKAATAASRLSGAALRTPHLDHSWLNRQSCSSLDELAAILTMLSGKTGFEPVVTVSRSHRADPPPLRFTPVRTAKGYCFAHIESANTEEDLKLFESFSPKFHLWLIDHAVTAPSPPQAPTTIVRYDDDLLALTALADFIHLMSDTPRLHVSTDNPSDLERLKLLVPHAVLVDKDADIGVAMGGSHSFQAADVDTVRLGGAIVAIRLDAIGYETAAAARIRHVTLHRLDLSQALASEVQRVFDTLTRIRIHAGERTIDGVKVVAGGVIGGKGDFVVDSIASPTIILGKADGSGGILPLQPADDAPKRIILDWILAKS